jgi:1-acyl-sn-glycerol-3-phosphate acyltransferase
MTAAYGLAWCFGVLSLCCSRRTAVRLLRAWARLWIKTTGARIAITGDLTPKSPVLLVANHMSYFDVIVLLAAHPFIMVSAEEMRNHPILGRLLRNSGTIFVARDDLSGLRGFVDEVGTTLRRGDSVVVFPEGRIRCSAPGGPFAPCVMQAAIDTGVPVRPVLMWCELEDGRPTSQASWLGTESLRHSLQRLQRIRGLTVNLRILQDLDPRHVPQRTRLARQARSLIASAASDFPSTCRSHRPARLKSSTANFEVAGR